MKVEILEKKDNQLTLLIEDLPPSYVNTLRRCIMAEVPTLAIENVIFYENTSSLYDEMIAHRLGLIPIKTDLSLLNFRDECTCKGKGCANCTVRLHLDKEGPCIVYSHDIISDHEEMKPLPNIPIVKLGRNQMLSFEAEAILGKGKEHAKWQPAVVSYKYYPEIKISEECTACGACIEACPRDILKLEDGKVEIQNLEECILCKSCSEACELNAIEVRGNNRKFIFRIESVGSLPPEEIFSKACEIVINKAEELKNLI